MVYQSCMVGNDEVRRKPSPSRHDMPTFPSFHCSELPASLDYILFKKICLYGVVSQLVEILAEKLKIAENG